MLIYSKDIDYGHAVSNIIIVCYKINTTIIQARGHVNNSYFIILHTLASSTNWTLSQISIKYIIDFKVNAFTIIFSYLFLPCLYFFFKFSIAKLFYF